MGSVTFNLKDKVFMVTGGSRGIGMAIAAALLEQSAKVVICARKQNELQAAAAELDAGDRLLAVPAHVARAEEVEALFEAALEKFGVIDGLVNNVGMNIASSAIDAEPKLWRKIIDSNLNGSFLCARRAGQLMRERKKGKIVNISSIASRRSAPFMGIYGVAKAGIEMMTRVLAHELAPFNIQVNAVAPCMVRTKFSQPFWSNAEIHDQIVKTIPLGRIAEPADVAGPVLFFCSEISEFVTGQTLAVDGGASAV
jgi:2-deoxy-D-gluconate 3-dehydrogenase